MDARSISLIEIRQHLRQLIMKQCWEPDVLDILWTGDSFIFHEDALWDFKLHSTAIEEEEKNPNFQYFICDIAKDIVSFYNSNGGYIIFGVDNHNRKLIGFDKIICSDRISSRIKSDTDESIDFVFSSFLFNNVKVGMIFIPRRNDNIMPIRFKKNSKINENGKHVYRKNDVYMRIEDTCKKAETPEDYAYLFSFGIFRSNDGSEHHKSLSHSNLPVRDPTFQKIFGRERELSRLWAWIFDRYNPTKLISGIGGIGKTTLIRKFCEQLEEAPPVYISSLLWFSAKRESFRADLGHVVDNQGAFAPDFYDPSSLYRKILQNLGLTEEELSDIDQREEFIRSLSETLATIPAMIIIDDLDTLHADDQAEIFQTINAAIGIANREGQEQSRAIFTSRINLGAAPSQLIQVQGMEESDFFKLAVEYASYMNVSLNLNRQSKLFKRLYNSSSGSPLFLQSIIRLISMGESLDKAIYRWNNADGEMVRDFAFHRELRQLSTSQLRTLYALCVTPSASLVELEVILEHNDKLIQDDLNILRRYHLAQIPSSPMVGGTRFSVSKSISALASVIKESLDDPKRIEKRCSDLSKQYSGQEIDVAQVIRRIVALWQQGRFDDALGQAEYAISSRNDIHPNLQCVLGRCYMKVSPKRLVDAENALKQAYSVGCYREELFDYWFESTAERKDWSTASDIANIAYKHTDHGKYIYLYAVSIFELASDALRSGAQNTALTKFIKSGRAANRAFLTANFSGHLADIVELRKQSYITAVEIANYLFGSDDKSIELYEICIESFKSFVRTRFIILTMTAGLLRWLEHVLKRRDDFSSRTLDKINGSIIALDEVKQDMRKKGWLDTIAMDSVECTIIEAKIYRERYRKYMTL